MKTLVIGMGEVGRAHFNLLSKVYECHAWDLMGDYDFPPTSLGIEILHIAIRHSPEFEAIVKDYVGMYSPKVVNVLTTCPPGTCERLGNNVVHSTTRGLHPNLESGLLNITKHVGGPLANEVAAYFAKAGITCQTHALARETEFAHLANNAAYGVSIVLADELAKLARKHGVDYVSSVMGYTITHNQGYTALGHGMTKQRMVLTPPNGKIGGHCVQMSAQMLSDGENTPLIERVARF
jgi:UDP-N-acetyl-D-mannosaminuronate dehydrogenase